MYVSGDAIKMMRECSGKTALEIATSLGMGSSAEYDKWENDQELPNMNQFMGLCMVCGFNPAELTKMIVDKEGDMQLDEFREVHGQNL